MQLNRGRTTRHAPELPSSRPVRPLEATNRLRLRPRSLVRDHDPSFTSSARRAQEFQVRCRKIRCRGASRAAAEKLPANHRPRRRYNPTCALPAEDTIGRLAAQSGCTG